MAHPNQNAQNVSGERQIDYEDQKSAVSSAHSGIKLRLPDLPTDILLRICDQLIEWKPLIHNGSPGRMTALRITCRSIEDKTHDFFVARAFSFVNVYLNSTGLSRLTSISNHPEFASTVQKIRISPASEELSPHQAQMGLKIAKYHNELARWLGGCSQKLRHDRLRDANNASIARSTADEFIMASAFRKFPNLQTMFLPCMDEVRVLLRKHTGQGSSMSRIFSTVLSSLNSANARPQEISMWYNNHDRGLEGVLVSELLIPQPIPECLSELRSLKLLLETPIYGNETENPALWQSNLAAFLQQCPKLHSLHLSFRREWQHTEVVFHEVAIKVRAKNLKRLTLHKIRCRGKDLRNFLRNHPSLLSLELENLDVTGTTPFSSTLELLETTFCQLQSFKCQQITEKQKRLYLKSPGIMQKIPKQDPVTCYGINRPFEVNWKAEERGEYSRKLGVYEKTCACLPFVNSEDDPLERVNVGNGHPSYSCRY